jgi:hypothetical protein
MNVLTMHANLLWIQANVSCIGPALLRASLSTTKLFSFVNYTLVSKVHIFVICSVFLDYCLFNPNLDITKHARFGHD